MKACSSLGAMSTPKMLQWDLGIRFGNIQMAPLFQAQRREYGKELKEGSY
jgi:hypothetical protein